MKLVILKAVQNFYVLITLNARILQKKKVIVLLVYKTAILSSIRIINDVLIFLYVIFLMYIFLQDH